MNKDLRWLVFKSQTGKLCPNDGHVLLGVCEAIDDAGAPGAYQAKGTLGLCNQAPEDEHLLFRRMLAECQDATECWRLPGEDLFLMHDPDLQKHQAGQPNLGLFCSVLPCIFFLLLFFFSQRDGSTYGECL
ncbi:hypothetical protein HJG60_011127 [Phyllostomus discolor]|uniref:Uncharacterized protein n=1 Tax=Phyllostomus discolor TaxID=89673 RepID=A0A834A3F8_9CHIR|nr:hypothetical protein HJG60_011127 [Phyllostomus discolor]